MLAVRGFFAMLSRMKYINRWGLMRGSRTETLAEHTLETVMLTHALIEIGNTRFNRSLDAGQAVLLAIYHDCAEILTGDLPTPIKYHDPAIRDAYQSIEGQAVDRILGMLPEEMEPAFSPYVRPDERFLRYRPYVKAADKLSALIKCIEETKMGNREFEMAHRAALGHPALQMEEAQIFIKEYLPAYALPLDALEKYE